jgi:hypothetical protein
LNTRALTQNVDGIWSVYEQTEAGVCKSRDFYRRLEPVCGKRDPDKFVVMVKVWSEKENRLKTWPQYSLWFFANGYQYNQNRRIQIYTDYWAEDCQIEPPFKIEPCRSPFWQLQNEWMKVACVTVAPAYSNLASIPIIQIGSTRPAFSD